MRSPAVSSTSSCVSTVPTICSTVRDGGSTTCAFSVAKLTVAVTPSSLFNFFSMRAAQDAQVIPSSSSRTSTTLGRLVTGLVDRGAKGAVVELFAGHGDELRLEVD